MKLSMRNWLDWQLVAGAVLLVAAAVAGFATESNYIVQILTLTAIYAAVALAWSISGGLGGMLLLGYISFFGVGAYVNGILFTKYGVSPWLNLFIAGAFSAVVAWLIARITLRFALSEDYFAMFTVGVSQVIKYILLNWDYAGRARGIYITITSDDFAAMSFVSRKPYLMIALVLVLAVLVASWITQRSRLGYYLAAVRQNSSAAEALGIDTVAIKTRAIVLSGALAGAIGAFYCQFATFIDPKQAFSLASNFEMLLGAVLGGRLTLIGPLLGASIIKPFQDVLRGLMGGHADAAYLMVYGGLLVASCLLLPKGIAAYLEIWHRRRYGSGETAEGRARRDPRRAQDAAR